MKIIDEFSKDKNIQSKSDFLKQIYHGGYGINADGKDISAWYADDGIHLSGGNTARYSKSAQIIPWDKAAERIIEMLNEGTFATNVEVAEASGYVREKLAERLLYLYQDLSDEAREVGYLSMLDNLCGSGYPERTVRLTEKL